MRGNIMENISVGKFNFFDDQNFPHGFRRSGMFTIKEADYLETYGHTLLGLENKTIEPVNEDEKHFQDAILSHSESHSFAVKTWQKYRMAISSRSQKIFLSSHSGKDEPINEQD